MPIAVRREQALDAALALIADHGYGAITMEAIAREGNLAKPVLYNAYPVADADGARRFDPSVADNSPDSLGADGGIQTVIAWREEAWRNAVRLASATSDAERAQVAQDIENAANAEARSIELAYAYPPGQTSASRDAYCAVHHNDP